MRIGTMLNSGDVVLAKVQFVDSAQIKQRPAVVLFEEMGNVVVAGITSNTKMKGISLSKEDGLIKDSVIKLSYIFTITEKAIEKRIAVLRKEKRRKLYDALNERLEKIKV